MRIITRYILFSFLKPFFVCLLAFNMIFIVFDLFDNVSSFLEAGTPISYVLKYYGSLVFVYSPWFVPASLMLGTLYTMWILSRNSEIMAMRASGISFTSLAMPFFVVAFLCMIAIAASSEYITPRMFMWSERMKSAKFKEFLVKSDLRPNFPYYNIRAHRKWVFELVDVASEKTISCVSNRVTVTQEDADVSNAWIVTASRAEYLDGAWWFTNPRRSRIDPDTGAEEPEDEPPIGSPSFVRMDELNETPRDIVLLAGRREDEAMESMSARDMYDIIGSMGESSTKSRWLFHMFYRFASPWACLVITLFAVPAGLATARSGALWGMITAVGAFFLFYALSHFMSFLGMRAGNPMVVFACAWIPNVLFLTIGLRLYTRLI